MKTLAEVATQILQANSPAELFGADPKADFKRFAIICHPDKYATDKAKASLAAKAFKHLNELYAKCKNGHAPAAMPTIIGGVEIDRQLAVGDVCNVYLSDQGNVVKVPLSEADNDLMKKEWSVLKALHQSITDPRFGRYFPDPLDSTRVKKSRVNLLSYVDLGVPLHTLALEYDITFRHVVWIMNRALTAIGTAHQHGYVHGACIPPHLLYLPENHGLVLIDWTSASKLDTDESTPYVSKEWERLYPREIRKKETYTSTDIYMVAKSILDVIDANIIPKRFRPLFDYATAGSVYQRPHDAWAFQAQWKKAAAEQYGSPTFVELTKKETN